MFSAIDRIKKKTNLLMVDLSFSQNERFRSLFRLPENEQLQYELSGEIAVPGTQNKNMYHGKIYVSTSYLCFISNDKKSCSFAFPFSIIRKVERIRSNDYISVLTIFTWHMMKVAISFIGVDDHFEGWFKYYLRF